MSGIDSALSGILTARVRSEHAAQNLANVYTKGYDRKEVDVRAVDGGDQDFARHMGGGAGLPVASTGATGDAVEGAVEIAGIRTVNTTDDTKPNAIVDVAEMMQAKTAYETNMRVVGVFKAMALASLEINRAS